MKNRANPWKRALSLNLAKLQSNLMRNNLFKKDKNTTISKRSNKISIRIQSLIRKLSMVHPNSKGQTPTLNLDKKMLIAHLK